MNLLLKFLKFLENKNKLSFLIFITIFFTIYLVHYFLNTQETNPFIYFKF